MGALCRALPRLKLIWQSQAILGVALLAKLPLAV